jgi:formylglycine-generating enzyme required for sulfatase activity
VLPTTCVSWFQAEQACRLSGTRLLTNQEWQAAAASTPDPGTDDGMSDCNIGRPFAQALTPTGSRGKCVSRWGVWDMVGNATEYVADWGEQATTCSLWLYGDSSCVGGNSAEGLPGVMLRGGSFSDEDGGTKAGVFSVRIVTHLSSGQWVPAADSLAERRNSRALSAARLLGPRCRQRRRLRWCSLTSPARRIDTAT